MKMKVFQELGSKEHYDSQKDNLLKDFYIPALSNSKKYRRVVGYFNSKSLASVALGLKDFILNKGKMDLLCGVDLNPSDVNMIQFASEHPEEILTSNFLKELDSIEDEIINNHIKVLGWMVANNLLRIRVAVKINSEGIPVTNGEGILHYKIGLMYDHKDTLISFSGSVNETSAAWEKNLEEFHVFKEWKNGDLIHLKYNLDTFTDLWNSNSTSYKILDIPDAVEQKLIDNAPKNFSDLVFEPNISANNGSNNRKKIELYDYQKKQEIHGLKMINKAFL